MDATTPDATPGPTDVMPPNHHADHRGFAGVTGALAALAFAVGRGADADLALGLAAVGAEDDVVDIGCGSGAAVRRAAHRGVASVVGIDPAPVMLRVARLLTPASRRDTSAVRYVDGAAEALPLADGSATVVWALATVHHWRDLGAALGEVRRVLRPAGRFLAVERHTEPGATGLASHGWTDGQAHDFAALCRAAGLDAEVGHHRAGRKRVVSVLALAR
jgi:ubiquinone/menaquinone biosynthesis C-methylase UbiE